ncbi:PAS domain S-box protein [Corticibacter populi]|uniref:PAS domain S-box protein n=1 Tax=Corticibacter populi TaxID=1550736 RepID=A0A3M6QU73_9BURK|nr:PAS and helix-turn-helix domain-containing protein [Corticibacter populi]RMX06566.1 PAS domain S-box protein [Corticibacter populi]RZS31867.1 PAS domain S-box-containing protein [Corticibacter populi]
MSAPLAPSTDTSKPLPHLENLEDYRLAFEMAPVGLVISRHRRIIDCNQWLCEIFQTSRELLLGRSFLDLYPSADEFERLGERIAPILNARGHYSDSRIMKRANGQFFWCHVSGRAFDRRNPHAAGIWSFEDISAQRPVAQHSLTGREREVAARLLEGKTSKLIGKELQISHRTVEIYRARLMRKFGASGTTDLVQRMLTQ